MLSNFKPQPSNRPFDVTLATYSIKPKVSRLHLSYDLNNYQTLLTHLQSSQDPRWILFIAPPGRPNFQFLQQAGIDKHRIITLSHKQIKDSDKLFKEALCSRNYAAIIHWVNSCDKTLIDEINELTDESKTHSFVYCTQ